MTWTMLNVTIVTTLLLSSLFVLCQAQLLSPGALYGFENPVIPIGTTFVYYNGTVNAAYFVTSASQPWSFGNSTGIAVTPSTFDAALTAGIPDGVQYAFLQVTTAGTPAVLSATVGNLIVGNSYYVDFFWATRNNTLAAAAAPFNLDFVVMLNGIAVMSLNITAQLTSWARALSVPIVATATTAQLTFSNTDSAVSDQTILIDSVIIQSGTPPGLIVNSVSTGSFETPVINGSAYSNNLRSSPTATPTANNPWLFGLELAGLDILNDQFDPNLENSILPDGNQYAFIECSSTRPTQISVLAVNLTVSAVYYLDFYYALRYNSGNFSNHSVTLLVAADNVRIFSDNITTFLPWKHVQSGYFTAPSSGITRLTFTNIDATGNDLSVVIDAVVVRPSGYVAPVSPYVSLPGVLSSFESPVLTTPFAYGSSPTLASLPNATNPWTLRSPTWLVCGGIGQQNGAFDPYEGAYFVPDGQQYAYIQTLSPIYTSAISTNYTSLTSGVAYAINFWFGNRWGQQGNAVLMSLSVTVNGAQVFFFNMTSYYTWTAATTSSFVAPASGNVTVAFVVQSYNGQDNTVTIDAVQLNTYAPGFLGYSYCLVGSTASPVNSSNVLFVSSGILYSALNAAIAGTSISKNYINNSSGTISLNNSGVTLGPYAIDLENTVGGDFILQYTGQPTAVVTGKGLTFGWNVGQTHYYINYNNNSGVGASNPGGNTSAPVTTLTIAPYVNSQSVLVSCPTYLNIPPVGVSSSSSSSGISSASGVLSAASSSATRVSSSSSSANVPAVSSSSSSSAAISSAVSSSLSSASISSSSPSVSSSQTPSTTSSSAAANATLSSSSSAAGLILSSSSILPASVSSSLSPVVSISSSGGVSSSSGVSSSGGISSSSSGVISSSSSGISSASGVLSAASSSATRVSSSSSSANVPAVSSSSSSSAAISSAVSSSLSSASISSSSPLSLLSSSSGTSAAIFVTSSSSTAFLSSPSISSSVQVYSVGCGQTSGAPENGFVTITITFAETLQTIAANPIFTTNLFIPYIFQLFAQDLNVSSSTFLCAGVNDDTGATGNVLDSDQTNVNMFVQQATDGQSASDLANTLIADLSSPSSSVNTALNGAGLTVATATVITAPSSTATNGGGNGNGGIGNGAIAGAVIGSVVGACCLVILFFLLVTGCAATDKQEANKTTTTTTTTTTNTATPPPRTYGDVEMVPEQNTALATVTVDDDMA